MGEYCECYRTDIHGDYCIGTKELDKCDCHGDSMNCTFYSRPSPHETKIDFCDVVQFLLECTNRKQLSVIKTIMMNKNL